VSPSRWVSAAYLPGDVRFSHRTVRRVSNALMIWAALQGEAQAAPGKAGETARTLIAELERDSSTHGLVGPALSRAKDALAKAQGAAPTRAPLLEATALEWAEVARDLARASAAERSSDRLEQDASATQTEIARLRAAVEQTMARVGRAREDLKVLERGAAKTPAADGAALKSPPAKAPAAKHPASEKPPTSAPLGTDPPSTSPPAAGADR
jgi:hypothetical protein